MAQIDTRFPFDVFEPRDGRYLLTTTVATQAEGILAGDRLLVEGTDHAEAGQLVVTTSRGEATVRRHERAATDQIIGLVVGVMRRLK